MDPEMSYATKPASVEPETAPQSFFSRLIGVYFSPGEIFAGMASAPRPITPIIALALLIVCSSAFVAAKMPLEKMTEDRIQQQVASGQLTEERAEQQREGFKRIAPFMKFIIPITA
jgi:mannitol-specific phosphotransferase system IIBC component